MSCTEKRKTCASYDWYQTKLKKNLKPSGGLFQDSVSENCLLKCGQ